jgi:hypothetical protein
MNNIIAWCDAHLVPEWRKAHRFLSVQIAALNVSLLAGWAALPDAFKDRIPHHVVTVLGVFCLGAGVFGTLTNQKALKSV